MRIGIAGVGVVGSATKKMFEILGNKVIGYDKYKDDYKHNFNKLYDCDMVFMCLPTPTVKGKINISSIHDFLSNFKNYSGILILKSTVLPGTCKQLSTKYNINIVHNPEFLTEKNAILDVFNPSKIVIGNDGDYEITNTIHEVYKKFNCLIILTDTQTSELIKYACNCELAMQVSYANELFDICKEIGADYADVQLAMLSDERIGRFKEVTPERGFGGMCFPKDTQAFVSLFNSDMINAAIDVNNRVRK